MIESSVLCSSNWDSDIFTDFGSVSEVSPIFDIHDDYVLDGDITTPECLTPNEQSSSDYEEAFGGLDLFPISDGFLSEILEAREEETNANSGFFSDLDYLNSVDSSKKFDSPKEKSFEVDELKHMKDPFEYLQSTKLWSKMSSSEQLQTLHALSEIVTYHMGIREQMEIIKILDPTAIISPDDKEFALDSTFLNDLKLRRIKEFIHTEKQKLDSQKPSKSSFSSLVSSKKASSSSKLLSGKSNSSYSRTKRRQKKSTTTSNEPSLKRLKQNRKEKRSGFFVYEKKMKLVNPLEEDEDVNILE